MWNSLHYGALTTSLFSFDGWYIAVEGQNNVHFIQFCSASVDLKCLFGYEYWICAIFYFINNLWNFVKVKCLKYKPHGLENERKLLFLDSFVVLCSLCSIVFCLCLSNWMNDWEPENGLHMFFKFSKHKWLNLTIIIFALPNILSHKFSKAKQVL